jgi:glutaminyl-tRNA synthetase
LRFDDTNPETEERAYIDAMVQAVRWLGFDWQSHFGGQTQAHLYCASDYFEWMYQKVLKRN